MTSEQDAYDELRCYTLAHGDQSFIHQHVVDAFTVQKTKAAAVTKALQGFIARRRQKAMLDLAGKLEWDVEYHYKKERSRR